MSRKSELELIDDVKTRLVAKFGDVPEGSIMIAVEDAYAVFADSPVRDFVPLLVERRVDEELRLHPSPDLAYS